MSERSDDEVRHGNSASGAAGRPTGPGADGGTVSGGAGSPADRTAPGEVVPGTTGSGGAGDRPGGAGTEPGGGDLAGAGSGSGTDAAQDDSAPRGEQPGAGDGKSDGKSPASQANEETMNPEQTQVFEQFRDDLEEVERKIAGEIDPGYRAMFVAGAMFVLLLSLVLPHAGHTRGLDILLADNTARGDHIGLPSRVFEWLVLIFGIGFSSLALLTRRWALAWIAVAGSAVGSVFGVLSIWHRQTPGIGDYHGAGPGIGLIIAAIAMIVLTFHWLKAVWSRTTLHLAAEEQRRLAAREQEERDRRFLFGDDT
jgi:hypothetical protein